MMLALVLKGMKLEEGTGEMRGADGGKAEGGRKGQCSSVVAEAMEAAW